MEELMAEYKMGQDKTAQPPDEFHVYTIRPALGREKPGQGAAEPKENLALDYKAAGDTSVPTVTTLSAGRVPRQQWRVYFEDGRIQNVDLGDSGYLTRVPAEDGSFKVVFKEKGDFASQIWFYAKGQGRSEGGPPGRRYYTVVHKPVPESGPDQSIYALTATEKDGSIVAIKLGTAPSDNQNWDGDRFGG